MSEPVQDTEILQHAGHSIRVSATGTGDALLLIMGLGGNLDMWQPLIDHLPGRRIIRFDAPGTGLSSTPWTTVSVPALAELAVAVLDRFEEPLADVLGYSYGGLVAQQLAFQHGSRVRRLVLAATNYGAASVPGRPDAAMELASPWRYFMPSHFHQTAEAVYGGLVGQDAEVRAALLQTRTQHPPSPYGYALQLLSGASWSALPILGRIRHPTLVLAGDQDPLVPLANAEVLARTIPQATLHVLEGAGHLLLLDEPHRAAPPIHSFLKGVPVE